MNPRSFWARSNSRRLSESGQIATSTPVSGYLARSPPHPSVSSSQCGASTSLFIAVLAAETVAMQEGPAKASRCATLSQPGSMSRSDDLTAWPLGSGTCRMPNGMMDTANPPTTVRPPCEGPLGAYGTLIAKHLLRVARNIPHMGERAPEEGCRSGRRQGHGNHPDDRLAGCFVSSSPSDGYGHSSRARGRRGRVRRPLTSHALTSSRINSIRAGADDGERAVDRWARALVLMRVCGAGVYAAHQPESSTAGGLLSAGLASTPSEWHS